MILVTGGAGFIGANFVLDWLRDSDEAVLNARRFERVDLRYKVCAIQARAAPIQGTSRSEHDDFDWLTILCRCEL